MKIEMETRSWLMCNLTTNCLRIFALIILQSWLPLLVDCEQHVLLDTTKESMLDWTRYPYGPNSSTPGWVEESFTNFEKGINWRSYVVCDVRYAVLLHTA